MNEKPFITLIVLVVIAIGIVIWQSAMVKRHAQGPGNVACTMDAMMCPDGSYVGRVAPSCQFAECPRTMTSQIPVDWKTATQNGVTFRYPETISTYTSVVDFPPTVTVEAGTPSCTGVSDKVSATASKVTKTIGGNEMCVTRTAEGAAGSSYITYTYEMTRAPKLIKLSFTVRQPQCMSYDEPNRSACQADQAAFDPDVLAQQMIASVTY